MLTTTLLKPLRMSVTLRASPRGEVPSLSRRRGVSLTFRYLHFYRLHAFLYLNTSSIRLNSYAYKLLSPLSRPSGRQLSPRRASLLPTSIHIVSTRRVSLAIIVKSSHSYISFSKANIIFSISSQTPLKFLSITLLGNRINVIPKFLKYSVLLSSYSTCFSS